MSPADGALRPRDPFPLVEVRARLRAGAELEDAVAATQHLPGVPAGPLLAAARSHADLVAEPGAVRVCRGTSCELAGAARIAAAEAQNGRVRTAYCLGYCHRSPALLDENGDVWVDVDPARRPASFGPRAPLPSPPRIESLAPEAIVTRRIARGDFSQFASVIPVVLHSFNT